MPELAKLGHIALETPDLEESVWFFRDVLGLNEVERTDDTVYFRGQVDFEHHSLSLTQAAESGVNHIAYRTESPKDVGQFADHFEANGVDVTWVDSGTEAGQGEAVRFTVPHGHQFEIYYDIEKVETPKETRSRLRNRMHKATSRVTPRHIDHVNILDRDAGETAAWLQDHLGFQLNEYFATPDDEYFRNWLTVATLPHDVAVGTTFVEEEPLERLHHVAYRVENIHHLFEAADELSENDIQIDGGPGQHAMTEGKFLYFRDPASDIRVELYTGGYPVFDPDWEPIRWTEDDAGVAGDHQWIGDTTDKMGRLGLTPYANW
ncbi:VOC family protein [Halobellus captivus]|uniref:VOC family protein n=1 Tax=Halobellus captivus TaxID=2592614 RepID=UPI00119DCBDC|nr:VOC family protein [Halobellus captivus]